VAVAARGQDSTRSTGRPLARSFAFILYALKMVATFTLLALFLGAISADYVANNAMISLADIGNDQAATALSCLEDAKVDRAFNTTATSSACQQMYVILFLIFAYK
jgi:hypothetical protein